MHIRTISKTTALAAVALLAVAACSSSSKPSASSSSASASASASPSAQGDYVVGFEGGLTGAVAPTPADELLGLRAYFNMINQKGGVNGHHVSVVFADDTGLDTSKAVANFINFRDNVKPSVVVGPTVSTITDAVTSLIDAAQIPIMISSPTVAEEQNPYVYAVDIRFDQEAQIETQVVKTLDTSGTPAKVALFYANTSAGAGLATAGKAAIAANGWTLSADVKLPVPAPDSMTPQAQAVVSGHSDYVIGGIFLALPPLLMRALTTLGFTGSVVNFHGGATAAQVQQINNPNYYVLRSWGYSTDSTAGIQTMDTAVKAIAGDPSGDYLPVGYGAGAIIAKALASCGYPCPGAKMKTALDNVGMIGDLDGVFAGPIGFQNGSHQAVNSSKVYHDVDGKIVQLPTLYNAPN